MSVHVYTCYRKSKPDDVSPLRPSCALRLLIESCSRDCSLLVNRSKPPLSNRRPVEFLRIRTKTRMSERDETKSETISLQLLLVKHFIQNVPFEYYTILFHLPLSYGPPTITVT